MSNDSVLLGLVTVLYKSDDVLEGFFQSISRQTFTDYILYVIDNSPSEQTDQLLEQYSKQYPVTKWVHIKSSGNIGVAPGNNVGIKEALKDQCTYLVILNNDIEIESKDMFSDMVHEAITRPEQIVVPKIFYYDSRKLWMAGGYMDRVRALGVHYGMDKADAPQYNEPKYITYAPTCFMLVHKNVFDQVGLMDELYFAYYDDTDFVLRCNNAGIKLWYQPKLTLLHKVSSSAGVNSLFYVFYSNRNKVYFIRKNFSGIRKYFALCYTLASRVAFWLRFDTERRKKLVEGLKAGFRLPVSS